MLKLLPFQIKIALSQALATWTTCAVTAFATPPVNAHLCISHLCQPPSTISALMIEGATHRECDDVRPLSGISGVSGTGSLSDGSVVVNVTVALLLW